MASMKRGSVAIVGAAESDIGSVAADMSVIDLMAQGIVRALADAGLTLADVDGLFCATTQARTSAMSLAEYLKKPDAYVDSTIVGGSSFEIHVAHAQATIEAGLCSVAVVAYGSTQRSAGRKNASPREFNPYETPFKPFMPSTAYAMAANRNNWRKWRWQRGAGRSSIPLPLIKGRLISRACLGRRWCPTPSRCAIAAW
jgi:hypothetical protein